MIKNVIKWIWQHEDYPHFEYSLEALMPTISKLEYLEGQIATLLEFLDDTSSVENKLRHLEDEIVASSAIEGVLLKRKSVRASLLKKLDRVQYRQIDEDESTLYSDMLAELYIDAITNSDDLNMDRLKRWHTMLFQSAPYHETLIIGDFRDDSINVEDAITGYVHYEAPPAKRLQGELDNFLEYLNSTNENKYIQAAVAHLWFEVIHPFEDGNGRLGRMVADYILSRNGRFAKGFKPFSTSKEIEINKQKYYEELEYASNMHKRNTGVYIVPWIKWHCEVFEKALLRAYDELSIVLEKTKFWDSHREDGLNERESSIINHLFEQGRNHKLTTKSYHEKFPDVDRQTIIRDIKKLLKKGCIKQIEGTKGRNIAYKLVTENKDES